MVVAASNAGNWSVKTENVFVQKPNTSSFGQYREWF